MKAHSTIRQLIAAAGVVCAPGFFAACKEQPAEQAKPAATTQAAAETQEIVIGEVGSMTGSEATFGTSTRDGIALAVKKLNEAGGLDGRKIKVIVYDDQGKAEEAVNAATRLIKQDKVLAVLGEVASSRTIAIAPVAQQSQIPLLTPSSTAEKVTTLGDYVFRACFVDSFQGTVMGIYAANDLKATKAAILRDSKSDYSIGLAKEFEAAFKKFGGEIVKNEAYAAGDVHFKAQLTAIKAAKPDVVFIPGYYTEVGLILRQARELGIKATLLGGDGWDSPKLVEIAGKAADGAFFSNHYSVEADIPEVKKFVSDYEAAYNAKPDGYAALGYDAALVLFDAMRRAKPLTSQNLREALAHTKDVMAVTGKINIDASRNPSKPAVVLKVTDGKFHYLTRISPYPMP